MGHHIYIDAIVVAQLFGGILIGCMLKMDRGVALLTSIGSGICGAAAILGLNRPSRPSHTKTAVAVSP